MVNARAVRLDVPRLRTCVSSSPPSLLSYTFGGGGGGPAVTSQRGRGVSLSFFPRDRRTVLVRSSILVSCAPCSGTVVVGTQQFASSRRTPVKIITIVVKLPCRSVCNRCSDVRAVVTVIVPRAVHRLRPRSKVR